MRKQINLSAYIIFMLILSSSCGTSTSQKQPVQTLIQAAKDTCDDPDAGLNCFFINMPADISNIMTIVNVKDPGEPLIISGTLFKADGKTPYPNVLLYAYHTNHKGLYAKAGNETGVQKWHGYLHGWCKTDSKGYYEIRTIRPARYPDNSMPAHIHAAIKTESGYMSYITDYVFKDDSLVNNKYLSTLIFNPGGNGVVDIIKTNNRWKGNRDITIKD